MGQTCTLPHLSADPRPTKAELEALLRPHGDSYYFDDQVARCIGTILWRGRHEAADPDAFLVPAAAEVKAFPEGHSSYDAYLKSELWDRIRRRVLRRTDHRCECCGAEAKEVHLRDFRPRVLRGDDLLPLVAVCLTCHGYIHEDPRSGKTRMSHKEHEHALAHIYGWQSGPR
jgi:hypothetical protein